MFEKFDISVREVAEQLIDMSALLANKLQAWSDVITEHPDSPNKDVSAGFLNKFDEEDGVDLVVDIQAPASTDQALLRIWALESILDDDQTKVFNNIQLNFAVDYSSARKMVHEDSLVTRDDIRALLHSADTKLASIVISNRSGLIESSGEQRGEKYDLSAMELSEHPDEIDKIDIALQSTLTALKVSADLESSKYSH